MKKITGRAVSVLLIAALVVFGMVMYLLRYIDEGEKWALYFSRANSGSSGVLIDRNGEMLAAFDATHNLYNADQLTREANFHVTGDYWGRTGTGLISRYFKDIQDFSLLTGTTRTESSMLQLTVDAKLNNVIYEALGKTKNACMLVCNYRTGELLGMVSTPTVDPMDAVTPPREGAYINRCISSAFTPGSVFKLITSAAAIEHIANIDEESFWCDEEYDIAGVTITCMGPHYTQSFREALANSCNVAFAQIAVRLGQDTMIDYVRQYGFLDTHELSGIPTAKGGYPLDFVGDPELAWSGIGQSTDLVCPYSMLRYLCAIANDGQLIEPRIVRTDSVPEPTRLLASGTAERLHDMMRFNVEDHYEPELNFPGLPLCAKTGTAELAEGIEPHSWFVGFLEDEEHPYAFVTLIENGGYGITAAGSTANKVLQWVVNNL